MAQLLTWLQIFLQFYYCASQPFSFFQEHSLLSPLRRLERYFFAFVMSTCRFEAKQWVNPNNGKELFFRNPKTNKFCLKNTVSLPFHACKLRGKNSTTRRFLPPSTFVTTLKMHFDARNFTRHLKKSLLTKFPNLGFFCSS